MIPPDPALTFTPGRAAGLARWAAFLPEAGRRYAERRNFDEGPGHRANVSALSPWIRHRLVREDEVVAAALARHGERALVDHRRRLRPAQPRSARRLHSGQRQDVRHRAAPGGFIGHRIQPLCGLCGGRPIL